MRITNKMMSGNSLANINTNKEYLDKLNNQMATEKKITRPSDDPIIAIRALRLRSNLSELTQYYGANVPDAQAWVSVTQSAISSTKEILSSLKSYADQGANGTNTASDRAKIYENMNALKNQVYSNGNATNAGRSVFTGYRTDESLTFPKDTEAYYRDIKDTFNASDIVRANYTEGEIPMSTINFFETNANYDLDANPDSIDMLVEQDIMDNEVYRLRLSYDDLEIDTKVETETQNATTSSSFTHGNSGLDPTAGASHLDFTDDKGNIIQIVSSTSFAAGEYSNESIKVYSAKDSNGVDISEYITVAVGKDGKSIDIINTKDASPADRKVYNIPVDVKDTPTGISTAITNPTEYTLETDKDITTLTYREKLVGTQNASLSIPTSVTIAGTTKPGKDPVTGVINTIVLTDETGKKIQLQSAKGFTHQNSPASDLKVSDLSDSTNTVSGTVTIHNDGTITFMTPSATDSPRKVYNISADGRTITSSYQETDHEVLVVNSTDQVEGKEDVYAYMKLNEAGYNDDAAARDLIYMAKDTGELIMGSDIAKTLSELPDLTGTETISVLYNKTRFSEGDVKPQHYFDCTGYDDSQDYADGATDSMVESVLYDSHKQAINYTVGTNQQIQINTYAEDVFDTQIVREIDDVLAAITSYDNAEAKVDKLKKLSEERDGKDEAVEKLLKAANKELDLAKNKLQATYEGAITQFGNFFDQANQAETACGTVENRLNLVSNRLSEEQTTVKTLASDNENVDITNIAVEISEAELIYNAALMSTGRISQQTLVDYI